MAFEFEVQKVFEGKHFFRGNLMTLGDLPNEWVEDLQTLETLAFLQQKTKEFLPLFEITISDQQQTELLLRLTVPLWLLFE